MHGSKTAHAIDGATTASGSVGTLRNRMRKLATEPNVCFESGDIDVFADNVQKIGKTTRVRGGGQHPCTLLQMWFS